MAPSSVSGGCKGIHRCGRYPVSTDLDLSADEGKKEFRSAQTWRPSMYGRAHTSFEPLTTTAAVEYKRITTAADVCIYTIHGSQHTFWRL